LFIEYLQEGSVGTAEAEEHDGELTAGLVRALDQPQDVLNHLKFFSMQVVFRERTYRRFDNIKTNIISGSWAVFTTLHFFVT
jgi:hypothetical protein